MRHSHLAGDTVVIDSSRKADRHTRSGLGFDHPLIQFLFFAIVFWVPFYRWRHISPDHEWAKIDWLLAAALFVLIVPYILVQRRLPHRLKSNLNPLFAIFFAVNLMSSLLSPYQASALQGLATKLVFGYVLIALTALVVGWRGFTKTFPVVVCTSITICALLGIIGFYFQVEWLTLGVTTGIGEFTKRGVGGSMGANNSALMYLFCLPFLVHWIIYGRSQLSKLWAVAQILILLLGVVSTFSRGGFLMLCLVVSGIIFSERHRFHPRLLGPAMAVGCACVIIGAIAVPDSFIRRIQSLSRGTEADFSMSRRAAYVEVGWEVFQAHPLLGTGTDTFKYNWVNSKTAQFFKGEERYAHNTYIEVVVGSGVLGLLVFIAILARAHFNFSAAVHRFRELKEDNLESLAKAYRISFLCIVGYLLILSAIEHKLFLMALGMSAVAVRLSRGDDPTAPASIVKAVPQATDKPEERA